MGDVAGIGPEVLVRAWQDERMQRSCRPLVVGHPAVLARAVELVGARLDVLPIDTLDFAAHPPHSIPCWNPAGNDAALVPPGVNDARSGRAAYEYLRAATVRTLAGDIDAVTTAPLSKAALHLAGLHYPGHTEILAELCGVKDFAMMLYLPQSEQNRPDSGLGVVHVTLHTSIRSVPDLLSQAAILSKIRLIDGFLRDLGLSTPRVGVCALNPHAGEGGLFGDEEARLIAPAVEQAVALGILVSGPFPADTLLKRACAGEFDGVVAMYHDQGHIALKLVGFGRAVNVTLGLPLVRTSPSHGTAFDIAWQGRASGEGMVEAVCVAARLADTRKTKAHGCDSWPACPSSVDRSIAPP